MTSKTQLENNNGNWSAVNYKKVKTMIGRNKNNVHDAKVLKVTNFNRRGKAEFYGHT